MSIEIKNISKNFGSTCALDSVSLTFEENKIYGLLGRNGAGKTTLLNIITNRIFADSGEVLVDGIPSKENDQALKKIYMMGEKNFYPNNMKIKEIFRWTKEFYPSFDTEYANKLTEVFELSLNKNVKSLSTGYNSIFKVIIALSVNTPYVLCDEPVLGLDANHRDLFYRLLIERYSDSPSTFIISTHLIEEVANVIEDVIIIKKGKIIKNESREELMSIGYTVSGMSSLVDEFINGKEVIGIDSIGGLKSAYVIGQIIKESVPQGLEITKMDLQKLFIKLTNA
ncbi:MAG: ABC transporter ATP-binding protein [Anaerolineaceae bacterium]|nr:MAG: ABC transporter ATP-binding protein [Anaerolineaceae bacterium]